MTKGVFYILTYLILCIILIAVPAYNLVLTLSIKKRNSSIAKENGYIQIYIVNWLIFGLLVLNKSIYFSAPDAHLNWFLLTILFVLIAYICVQNVLPIFFLKLETFREALRANYDEKLYPVSGKQQGMFLLVAITVGICEELIFRGFLNNYAIKELGLSVIWSSVAVSVIFGLCHFMQGVKGIVNTFLFGILMSLIYLWSGSLLIPIIIHILYDLKPIMITRSLQKNLPA